MRSKNFGLTQYQAAVSGREQVVPAGLNTSAEQSAYKTGFADGFKACEGGVTGSSQFSSRATAYTQPRVVYRNTARSYARTASSRRVYYDYRQARKRTFWQKHRDKLTVAMGAGGGAILGGLFGGKKGAAIGALAGGGGSALYTYKIRHRSRRY